MAAASAAPDNIDCHWAYLLVGTANGHYPHHASDQAIDTGRATSRRPAD